MNLFIIFIVILIVLLLICTFNKTHITENTIWTYWDQGNKNISPFHNMCIKTWRKMNPEHRIIIVDKYNIFKYICKKDLPPNWKDIESAQHKSDFVRLALLEKYGGIWLDITTICVRPINSVFNQTKSLEGFVKTNTDVFENWFITGKKGSKIIKKWKEEMLKAFGDSTDVEEMDKSYFDGVDFKTTVDRGWYLTMHRVLLKLIQFDDEIKDLYYNDSNIIEDLDTAFLPYREFGWDMDLKQVFTEEYDYLINEIKESRTPILKFISSGGSLSNITEKELLSNKESLIYKLTKDDSIFNHKENEDDLFSKCFIKPFETINPDENQNCISEKTIWTYWDQGKDDIPIFSCLCINTWKRMNPDHRVIIVDNNNVYRYIYKNDLPTNWKNINKPQHKSDFVRIALLEKYGGIWMDITTICVKPINSVFNQTKSLEGFALRGYDNNNGLSVFENWFITGKKGSKIIKKWKEELLRVCGECTSFENIDNKNFEGVDLQKLGNNWYFTMHKALMKLNQLDPEVKDLYYKDSNILGAEKTAFFQYDYFGWDMDLKEKFLEKHDDFIDKLKEAGTPILKFVGSGKSLSNITEEEILNNQNSVLYKLLHM